MVPGAFEKKKREELSLWKREECVVRGRAIHITLNTHTHTHTHTSEHSLRSKKYKKFQLLSCLTKRVTITDELFIVTHL